MQPKLTIGAPNDKYEQEADRVANQIMRMQDPSGVDPSPSDPKIQRQCTECEEEVRRQPMDQEEEEVLQTKEQAGQTPTVTSGVQGQIEALKGAGQPLSHSLRSFYEPRFGHDFDDVRIHTGADATDTARTLNARAYTIGKDVVFGAGQYDPGSSSGKRLLAHELTHAVQQSNGRQRIQRQVQIDRFATSATATAGFDPDMTTAFLAGMRPGGLQAPAGLTRFSVNSTPYSSANTIAQDLSLPLLSERDLRTIPQPNLRDPKLARVWRDEALVSKGQEATAVRLVQQALQAWGRGKVVPEDPLSSFGSDAIFGDETFDAVHKFQTEWAGAGGPLTVDGKVGPLTLAALEAAMTELNVSEFWLNTAPHNHITGAIHHILPPASWSVLPMQRSTLEARALAARMHIRSFARCRRPDNRLNFSAQGPANLDQGVLAHEQIHETDIGRAVTNRVLPWHAAVTQLVASGQRFRAVSLPAAEALIYAEIGRRTAPTAGDPCSVGGVLETDLVNFEFALHRLPGGSLRFTGFTTNTPRCTNAQANIDALGTRPRQVPMLGCRPSPHMVLSVRVPA